MYITATILIIIGIAIAVVETGWAKNRIRDLIVRQANQYLTATLEIGRLEGSFFRGIKLGDIRLSRNGHTIVAIDDVSLSYSLRELFQPGVVIREIRLARPRVAIARTPEGRWDITDLVRHDAREQKRSGPGRPIEIDKIVVFDGDVELHDPLDFGAVHAPTAYRKLNFTGAFAYAPVKWKLTFAQMSWIGGAPDLTVNSITGILDNGSGGTVFRDFSVKTPTSDFVLDGDVVRGDAPTTLDLRVHAARFAFQEWAGVLHGLKNIAIDSAFDTQLKGPLERLATTLALRSNGGSVTGTLVLNARVPGWLGAGTVDVGRLDLARWLNRNDRPSDISGRVTFDLALELGNHFPRGSYRFSGPHADYMHYAGDDVRANGTITEHEVIVASATARSYGAGVTLTSGSIGIDEPFPFHFQGTMTDLDLRRVPATIPVPRVESVLTLDYDVTGRFSDPFIKGNALFARSQFLGALVDAGTVGSIYTRATPLRYTGDGSVRDLDVRRMGAGLDVAWMQDPRYEGRVAGHFRVDGAGADRESLVLTASGRLDRADLFHGRLTNAYVTLGLSRGTLTAAYDGRIAAVDPAIALDDPRFAASLTGAANVRTTVRDLLTRTPEAADYDIDGVVDLTESSMRGIELTRTHVDGQFHDAKAQLRNIAVSGPAIEGHGSGTVAFTADAPSDFEYDITRADLSQLTALTGQTATGLLSTKGRLTGPWTAMRLAGDASAQQPSSGGVTALTATGQYDITIPSGDGGKAAAKVTGQTEFLTIFGQAVPRASGTLTLADERLAFDTHLALPAGRSGALTGAVVLHPGKPEIDIAALTVAFEQTPWRLAIGPAPPWVTWSAQEISVSPVRFVNGTNGDQSIDLAGTWREDGNGALRVTATHVFLETLQGAFEPPARYGGVLDLDATIRGTRQAPIVTGRITVSNGRVRRFSYQKLAGQIDLAGSMFTVDLRLDQAPGVWITAVGTVPLGLLKPDLPEKPIDLAVTSSPIGLGLLEGLTDVVRNVSGEMKVDVKAIGTSRDPHFEGAIDLTNAAFLVSASGSRYKNGRAALRLARDRVGIDALHLEDSSGHPLDVHGSLGTHELGVGDLQIDATARRFEVIHNEFGRVDVDASLQLGGKFEAATVGGEITINSGDLKVDEILARLVFQPYATEQTSIGTVEPGDAVAALNPWNRLGVNVTLHVPKNNLKLTGENVQVSPGTPIGLGNINLRVGGDLSLYKDPGQPLSVTGSLDQMSGTYGFQGRTFDVDESSSINFHGDLNPEVFVSVTRVIASVQTRVTITGQLSNPELRLASNPPLEQSDILSLIVFNVSTSDLSTAQQGDLAVRAGTLAAGFIATPLVSALQQTLGIDTFAIEPAGEFGVGPKLTVGQEIAPGLVARYSRQFGLDEYDEATVELYLSKLFRIRATFSDASGLLPLASFRLVERAGVDLLFSFSF